MLYKPMITLKGNGRMKITKKRIILTILGITAIAFLSVAAYFYVALSGNPIVKWQEKQAVLRIYEDRYDEEDFKVIRSHYDYKRGEYFYTLEPEENPHLKFTTSVYESAEHDLYAELRAEDFIRQSVEDALNGLPDPLVTSLTTTMNIHEQHTTSADAESDVLKRLRQNTYVISVSMDVDLLDTEAVDAATIEMGHKIDTALDTTVGGLNLRVSVYDGDNYHFSDVNIR